jgi:NAD(P)-dependent dehydrogenase (short-subunit alcohol dehydrogenase family)
MWDELVGEAKTGYFAAMAERVPAGKVAATADVAPAYIYLMGNEFMTGETIHIDGGQRLV